MKLRNKKTGEIVYATMVASYGGGELRIRYYPVDRAEDAEVKEYHSIAKLNEEWEDYEEPKEWWYIDIHGAHNVIKNDEYYQVVKEASKEIGNYFETKEEAEKAVEKLKAWKRLKDKGFRFEGWDNTDRSTIHNFSLFVTIEDLESINKDLDLLFGGEE